MDQDRFRQILEAKLQMQGGNYLDGSGMAGGNYLDGGKLTKKGVKLRDNKSVKARPKVAHAAMNTKHDNPWLAYIALERQKKVNSQLTYKELLQNIDKEAYLRWKKREGYESKAAPKKKAPAKKPAAKKAAPKKAASKK